MTAGWWNRIWEVLFRAFFLSYRTERSKELPSKDEQMRLATEERMDGMKNRILTTTDVTICWQRQSLTTTKRGRVCIAHHILSRFVPSVYICHIRNPQASTSSLHLPHQQPRPRHPLHLLHLTLLTLASSVRNPISSLHTISLNSLDATGHFGM